MRVIRFALSVLLIAVPASAFANPVSEMRVIGDEAKTRFVMDLEDVPEFGVVHLTNPNRLVIDMPEVEFDVEAKPVEGRGLVADYRFGLIAPGRARVVLDLAKPAEVEKSFVLDPVGNDPARLVLDLTPVSQAEFSEIAAKDRPRTVSLAPERSAQGPAKPNGLPVVVIDPGHGGIDSGAIGPDGMMEKAVTLTFAKSLAARLTVEGKVKPVLTREADDFLSLTERVEFARDHGAALFISVHADSVTEDYVRGATVYTLSEDASDSLAAALAARENRSDILAGLAIQDQPDDVADILFDLARRETKNLSVRFAKELVDGIGDAFALNKSPWRRASFMVLKAPDVPSVLLELGYLSNAEDEDLFKSKDWLDKSADAIGDSIEGFLSRDIAAGQ